MKFIISFFAFISLFANVQLTNKEKEFIKNHPILILGTSIEWEPYSITKSNKSVVGFDMDILNLVNKYTGIRFIEQTGNWVEIQKLAQEKKIDGLATVIKTKKREKYFNFSIPYTIVYTSILVPKGNPKNIHSEKDLIGKTIALQKGNKYNEILAKRWNKSKIIWLDTYLDLIKAVIYGKADATYDTGTAEYVTSTHGLPFLQRAFHLKNKLPLRFAIRKDYPEAISILNKGLKNIPETEFARLRAKWFLYSPMDYILTQKEKEFLNKEITVCPKKDLRPISFLNRNNQYEGISIDILKIIEQNLNKKFKFSDHNCDIYPVEPKNSPLKKTIPYLKYKIIAISNSSLLTHFRDIKNKPIVLKDKFLINFLKEKFPNINITKVDTLEKQFKMANEGYITLSIIPIFKYYKNIYPNLKIISFSDKKCKIFMGVKNEILLSILNKELKSISNETKQAIEDKWLNIKVIQTVDYKFLFIIVLGFLIIIFIILFWIHILHKNKKLLQDAKAKADENAKLKEEFLSIMSHEIKTPLNSIIGMSELMLHTPLNKKQTNYMKTIYNNSKKLLTIINDILDFSKLEKDKLELSIIEFDLYNLVNEIIELLKPEIEKKGLNIYLSYEASKIVYGDNTKISQILFNLIGNAIKFTEKGKIEIIITQKENVFRFEIKDTGIGIDKEVQKKLFDSFTQANSSINRKYGGSGLGLSISKKLIELMNGKIWIESEVSKGSNFIFEIQLKNQNIKIEKNISIENEQHKLTVDKTFENSVIETLKEKLKTNQPSIINPYLEEISEYNFNRKLNLVISLAKEYKFKEALNHLNKEKEK